MTEVLPCCEAKSGDCSCVNVRAMASHEFLCPLSSACQFFSAGVHAIMDGEFCAGCETSCLCELIVKVRRNVAVDVARQVESLWAFGRISRVQADAIVLAANGGRRL